LRLLLDTNVLLWTLTNPSRLSRTAREAIEAGENSVHVSVVSPWEISIKTSLGNLPALDDLEPRLADMSFELLPIALRHAKAIEDLPHHHGDPFDRMLIAQTQVENLVLVTSDRKMRHYDIALLPAR
jgi:PIN domain nuclease of toxin-antitoxin system